jgi:hypothetical protein
MYIGVDPIRYALSTFSFWHFPSYILLMRDFQIHARFLCWFSRAKNKVVLDLKSFSVAGRGGSDLGKENAKTVPLWLRSCCSYVVLRLPSTTKEKTGKKKKTREKNGKSPPLDEIDDHE